MTEERKHWDRWVLNSSDLPVLARGYDCGDGPDGPLWFPSLGFSVHPFGSRDEAFGHARELAIVAFRSARGRLVALEVPEPPTEEPPR